MVVVEVEEKDCVPRSDLVVAPRPQIPDRMADRLDECPFVSGLVLLLAMFRRDGEPWWKGTKKEICQNN